MSVPNQYRQVILVHQLPMHQKAMSLVSESVKNAPYISSMNSILIFIVFVNPRLLICRTAPFTESTILHLPMIFRTIQMLSKMLFVMPSQYSAFQATIPPPLCTCCCERSNRVGSCRKRRIYI